MSETKLCNRCNLELPLNEFYHENGKPKTPCKKCRLSLNKISFKKWSQTEQGKKKLKENRKKYEQKISDKRRIIREEKRKVKEELNRQKEIRRQQREQKKQLKIQKKMEWEKQMEYYKTDEWKEIKKQKERDRQYRKWKRRWNEDESFALKVRLRNLIRNSFRRGGYNKFEKKTEDIIGINYNDFKKYMESKFLEGMSWTNRGEWHIDHIIPLSSATSEDEIIKLCHYLNLQPLWGEDNIKKGDKIL